MTMYDGARYYHGIPGLLIPKKTDKAFQQIHADINNFIDAVPGMIEAIEGNFANLGIEKRRAFFKKNMELLLSLLRNVYARGLEADAMRLLRYIENDYTMDQAVKLIPSFVMDALSLSVAMQKAQNVEEEDKEEAVSEIEFHANIAKSLSAVRNLIDDGEHEKAQRMTTELVVYNPTYDAFVKLLHLITQEKYNEAIIVIEPLLEKHMEAITQLAGTDLSKKILAVDDMPEILSFVNNALKSHYRVIAVPSGKAALKVLEMQTPDLFILDIDMPEMDGFELARIIRGKAEYALTPLLFLTGNSTREHITNAMAVGCNDFIVKPANHEYLLTKVGKYLHSDNQ